MTELLRIDELSYAYKKETYIYESAQITIDTNNVIGFVAPNGAGKTTLFKLLSGNVKSDEIRQINKENKVSISYIGDQSILFDNFTGLEFLNYMAHGTDNQKEKLEKFLAFFDVGFLSKKIGKLSLGQRQIIFIISSFLTSDQLILLDEPFNGLDPLNTTLASKFIKKFGTKYNQTIIVSSHIMLGLAGLASKVWTIEDKKISIHNVENWSEQRLGNLFIESYSK